MAIYVLIPVFGLLFLQFGNLDDTQVEGGKLNQIDKLLTVRFELEPRRMYYYDNEEFGIQLKNRSSHTIYIQRPSGNSTSWRLQKMENGRWINLDTTTQKRYGIQVVMYSAVESGASRFKKFPHENLRELGKKIPGTYRYTVVVTPEKSSENWMRLYSEEFIVRSSD